jgi:nitrogen regulatory protein PII
METEMKLLKAIIRQSKIDDVKQALVKVGVQGVNIGKMEGYTRDKVRKEVYRAAEYEIDTVDMALLETVIEDDVAQNAVNTIVNTGSTGHFGDGRVFLIDVAHAADIRTGTTGSEAITR